MPELHMPWLEVSIAIPLLSAFVVGLSRERESARRLCVLVCGATVLVTVAEWIDFAAMNVFEARDRWDWIGTIVHRNVLVVDELSAPLLSLVALVYFLTVLSTLRTKVGRFSFGWTLVSEAIVLAMFSCRDPWVLIALFAVSILPPWVELRTRRCSTRIFVLHMIMFVGMLVGGQLCVGVGRTEGMVPLIGGALLTGAALLRSGVIPLHGWMTDLFENATFGTALLYVLPMSGAYALMRLVVPLAPSWALQCVAIVSLATAAYAAAMALVQIEPRRFFCYLFLSHSSLVLVGMQLGTPIGVTGALCVWLAVGLSLGGFGLTLRCIEARCGRISLAEHHGLYEHTPTLALLFLVTGLAAIGFPGTVGFVGAELLVEGAVEVYPYVGIAVVLAAALNGIAVLHAYFRIFTGVRHAASVSLRAVRAERVAVVILVVLMLGGGIFPQPGVTSRYKAAMSLIRLREENGGLSGSHTRDQSSERTMAKRIQTLSKNVPFSEAEGPAGPTISNGSTDHGN